LAMRRNREQIEECFTHASERLLESFTDGLRLVGIRKDYEQTEVTLAVRIGGRAK
jgi:hypothetical protein